MQTTHDPMSVADARHRITDAISKDGVTSIMSVSGNVITIMIENGYLEIATNGIHASFNTSKLDVDFDDNGKMFFSEYFTDNKSFALIDISNVDMVVWNPWETVY